MVFVYLFIYLFIVIDVYPLQVDSNRSKRSADSDTRQITNKVFTDMYKYICILRWKSLLPPELSAITKRGVSLIKNLWLHFIKLIPGLDQTLYFTNW